MRPDVGVAFDARFREHVGPTDHPERPQRMAPVQEAIAERGEALAKLAPRPAEPEEILRVHGRDHVELVAEAARRAPSRLDPDTFVCARSYEVALLAAGASVDLALRIASGELRAGLAAVRPPGHHAEARRPMGFCLFNNAAIAARALQATGVERILLFDFDVHHGNGTQHSFEEDPNLLYASTHQFPFYPGSGNFGEAGRGAGLGATLNIPMPAGCGDLEYTGVMQRLLVPAARAFRPDLVLVSAGFDAHQDDPLGSMRLTEQGFREIAALLRALADELCAGRLACVLEGGYAETGLREGTRALLGALLAPMPLPPTQELRAGSALARIVAGVVAVHGDRVPGLGAA
jgi:acetoin utilization deacetylase AcuC-like enzyme